MCTQVNEYMHRVRQYQVARTYESLIDGTTLGKHTNWLITSVMRRPPRKISPLLLMGAPKQQCRERRRRYFDHIIYFYHQLDCWLWQWQSELYLVLQHLLHTSLGAFISGLDTVKVIDALYFVISSKSRSYTWTWLRFSFATAIIHCSRLQNHI